ncbi:hypothetical protein KQX63_06100 [Rhodopseudomonas palustris]|jgi:hypothetical protein|uniref:DUF805 domain-containing protein n=1 Tax=Rhodopseudomonas palustris TaxID=1076 RepID=A0AAX3E1M0_RHOPL|nr:MULTISPECIES: DUF6111 family protein [Rhodopseudomonas]AVT75309.1 hypothetical protein RPPS3_12460 [Rhodopseudomonas palustris]AVT80079.1 hypothetical protein RPYSC3_12170 [Rhodopseudomonas palustris]NEV77480.1 hypothetical protein [Rhodopseudomonas sp. BR0C11]NEW96189.1 hypothetical protein [Rhodopseudomonas sp. BR0G17]UYO40898.1 hypothetical protein KQX62_06225 [Rhodopseudomonas palustris]
MIRVVLTEVGIFLIPFVLYAVFLIATRSAMLHHSSWPLRVVGWLVATALVLVILSLLLLVHYSGAPPGSTYVPAHMENGRLVPGVEK